jgi:hypothetical protein
MPRPAPAATAVAALSLIALFGCAGTTTYVSEEPPPVVTAEAWYSPRLTAVRIAVEKAVTDEGMVLNTRRTTDTRVVARKEQLPHESGRTVGLVSDALPYYVIDLSLTAGDSTHVAATLSATCTECDGTVLYVWDRPDDLVRRVLVQVQGLLNEKYARFNYPTKFEPPEATER